MPAVVFEDSFIYVFGGYTRKGGDYFNDIIEFRIPEMKWYANL